MADKLGSFSLSRPSIKMKRKPREAMFNRKGSIDILPYRIIKLRTYFLFVSQLRIVRFSTYVVIMTLIVVAVIIIIPVIPIISNTIIRG